MTLEVSYDGRRVKDFTRDEEQEIMTGDYVSTSTGAQSESRHNKLSVIFNKEAREVNFTDDVMPKVVEALEGMVPVGLQKLVRLIIRLKNVVLYITYCNILIKITMKTQKTLR